MSDEKMDIGCSRCGKVVQAKPTSVGNARLPMGWHRGKESEPICSDCWHAQYVLRAFTVPIAGPVDGEWSELRPMLKSCWSAATHCANWAVTELAKNHPVRKPGDEKICKTPALNLYTLGNAQFGQWASVGLDSGTAAAIMRQVQSKFNRRRYDVFWLQEQALPTYRYPYPYPIRSQDWGFVDLNDGQSLGVNCRMGGRRWTLRLRGGVGFWRQIAALRNVMAGEGEPVEMSILRRAVQDNDNRPGHVEREKNAQRVSYREFAKIVCWVPRKTDEREGVLNVRTDSESFLVATINDERIWWLHSDHVRRWLSEYGRRSQRFADDMKYERRRGRERKEMYVALQKFVKKHRDRIDSFVHEASSMVVGLADRRCLANVVYDDSIRNYFRSFPYDSMRQHLEYKCEDLGIMFSLTSGGVAEETPEPLATA